ncbi:hypothetical protein Hanom_Chr06g00559361 [Helianthus anomalus]
MKTPATTATPAVAVTESFVAVEAPLASPLQSPQSPRTLVAAAAAPLLDSVDEVDCMISDGELSPTAAAEVTATKAMAMSARTIIWRAIFGEFI